MHAIQSTRAICYSHAHMIHAADHAEASPLMVRAYRKVSGRPEIDQGTQVDFDELWRRIEADEE